MGINLFEEPIQDFRRPEPGKAKILGVYFPGTPEYEKLQERIRQDPGMLVKNREPYGYIWCLNIKRRAEFALRKWIEQQPGNENALSLIDGIMFIQDYIHETTTTEQGYSQNEQNDRIDVILGRTSCAIKELGGDDSDLWK